MDEEQLRVARAARALDSAKLLSEKGFLEDAFSRAYFFAVKEKAGLSSEDVRRISKFQALRESGDYAPVPAMTKADLAELIAFVEKLFSLVGGRK